MKTLKKTLLHVGCGPLRPGRSIQGFEDWRELRFDIDPEVKPDLLGTMTDMLSVETASVDAIFSSHNIEHLYPHEVPVALAEFQRVLKPEGYVVITCPDLQSVCALVADDKLTETAYDSPAGPISALDILYGHRAAMNQGNLYMAHRCGFTKKVLAGTLQGAGFKKTASIKRTRFLDLWIVGTKMDVSSEQLQSLAVQHFPQEWT
jgi:predicted SAM-dependent methyltransferase